MVLIVYGLYAIFVLRTNKVKQYLAEVDSALSDTLSVDELPSVSIVMPACNEEKVITRKIREIEELDYPKEKIEVLPVNDGSTDSTFAILKDAATASGRNWKVLSNPRRMGTNACYNLGVSEAKGELIFTTDIDVTVDRNAVMHAAKVLVKLPKIGGVTSRPVPKSSVEDTVILVERSYRALFEKMSLAESAIHSTFPGNTACILLRKSCFVPMPVKYGSSDGNISIGIIRRGFRLVYVPQVFFYEHIAGGLARQRGQKTRRAARQDQTMLQNRDMLFKRQYGSFGRLIFPLRFAINILCPPLLLIGGVLIIVGLAAVSPFLELIVASLVVAFTLAGMKTRLGAMNRFSSFLLHEIYLFLGLVRSLNTLATWSREPTKG